MSKRLVRWITYSLAFALLPLATTVLLRHLTGTLSVQSLHRSPELLFFSLMICATGLGDVSEMTSAIGKDTLFRFFFSVFLLGAVFSGILYGSFVYDTLIPSASDLFRERLFRLSLWIACVYGLAGILIQVFIARTEGES